VIPPSREVYRALAEALDPVFAGTDMIRVRGLASPCWGALGGAESPSCFLSVQVDRKATDSFAGGGFRIELERSRQRVPARGLTGRALFFQLLTEAEIAALLAQQNAVIRSLPTPPATQVDLYLAGPVRQQYLKYFQPQQQFDPVACWLRYRTDGDVLTWGRLIAPLAIVLLERASSALEPDVLHLGKGPLKPAP
jgi:hypothetical protein